MYLLYLNAYALTLSRHIIGSYKYPSTLS
jgi:hypothetical protein